MTISECVRSNPGRGLVKSLELIGSGPVGLVHTQKVGIKYKKPTLICDDTPRGGQILNVLSPTDRTHCHSGIFFSYAKIFGPFGTSYQRASSDLDIMPLGRQQNHNELSVLQAFGRIGELVARTLFMMRLVFEAIFFRPADLVRCKTHHQPALVICDVRYLGQSGFPNAERSRTF
jgi:hypothetical protein